MKAIQFVSFDFYRSSSGNLAGTDGPSQPAPVNQDVLKALRQTGFPDVESKATGMSLAPEVIGNIQKRLNKLDDAGSKISAIPQAQRSTIMGKNLCCIAAVNFVILVKSGVGIVDMVRPSNLWFTLASQRTKDAGQGLFCQGQVVCKVGVIE